ncbi:MAG: HepT-like ribonuclease domain-containing protein [Actinomycetota bacterium]|jgi:uncharacterized protein with HEPN domain
MTEMCDLLLRYAADAHALEHDPVVQAAAQRWIEVLGEAASHVSDELKATHPEVPWRELAGMRVVLAHAYHHIEHDIVGAVVARDIPALRRALTVIISEVPAAD